MISETGMRSFLCNCIPGYCKTTDFYSFTKSSFVNLYFFVVFIGEILVSIEISANLDL